MTTITDNPFGDDFDVPESDSNKIEYDRWGRYANLPSVPGVGVQPWTRVSTLAKTLEDTYYLDLWKQRQIILGIKENPSLLEAINGARFNPTSQHGKNILNSIASQAMETAGSYMGATKGTNFHNITEQYDLMDNHIPDGLSADEMKMLRAYVRTLESHEIRIIPELMERVVVCPSINVAGRLDRIVSDGGKFRIGDVKSQKSLDFGHMSLAIQLAVYANASHMLDMESWSWAKMPEIDKSTGVIIWVPAEEPGRAEIHDVDLAFGWRLAQAAVKVREWRKTKGVVSQRAL